jgi:hypothetical protein
MYALVQDVGSSELQFIEISLSVSSLSATGYKVQHKIEDSSQIRARIVNPSENNIMIFGTQIARAKPNNKDYYQITPSVGYLMSVDNPDILNLLSPTSLDSV